MYKPQNDDDYKTILRDFLRNFISTHLSKNQPSEFQKSLFYIKWGNTSKKLNPDIGGSMTSAILNSSNLLSCSCCKDKSHSKVQLKLDGSNIDDSINPYKENMAIILEIYKFVGKEINIIRAYEIFRKIQSQLKVDEKANRYTDKDIRSMFIVALQNLKYIGYISSTRRNTFTFKKNFFGKPCQNDDNVNEKEDEIGKIKNIMSATGADNKQTMTRQQKKGVLN